MQESGIPSIHSGSIFSAAFSPRKLRLVILLAMTVLGFPGTFVKAEEASENLVLVTLDGVRWQEVFGGVDLSLLEDERYTSEPDYLKKTYWREQRAERRKQLFPFLWSVIDAKGVLIGDRDQESYVEVSNDQWFSYPGYNEILTGRADPTIDSNDKKWNPNVTFLEVLNGQEEFRNRVLAFGSWDVFPYIINTQRSGLPVNAGFSIATPAATEETQWLNDVSADAPKLWSTVRVDFLTHGYAMEALKSQDPRIVYIAYGETDDFAHDGSYDRYIDAAHRTDQMLAKLWNWLQASPLYRDRTTLIITTDHGRGRTAEDWMSHAGPGADDEPGMTDGDEGIPGSNEIWLAAIGPQVKSTGLVKGNWKQSQIVATALATLQLDATRLMPQADSAIKEVLQ